MTNLEYIMNDRESTEKCIKSNGWYVDRHFNTIHCCDDTNSCERCLFFSPTKTCAEMRNEWLQSQRNEYQIPFNTPVDTLVSVTNSDDENVTGIYRYFSGRFDKDGKALVWCDGRTSYTIQDKNDVLSWERCKVVNLDDVKKD